MLPTNLRVNRQPGARNEARGSLLLVMHPLFRMNFGFDPQIGKLRMVLSQGGRLLTGSYLLGGMWGGLVLPARPRDPWCPKGLPATLKNVVVTSQ